MESIQQINPTDTTNMNNTTNISESNSDSHNYLMELAGNADAPSTVDCDLFASCAPPIKPVPILVDNQVFNIFRSGLEPFFDPRDVGKAAGTYRHTVIALAGDKNTACFPKSDFAQYYYYPPNTLTDPYIFSDFAIRFLAASKFGPKNAKLLAKRIYQKLLTPEQLICDKAVVHAHMLRGYLSPGTSIEVWMGEMRNKNPKIAKYLPRSLPIRDFYYTTIPISIARDSALKEGTFAGLVASILLLDGGFFHGGGLLDGADYSLLRTRDLLPNILGRVSIPELHKFLRDPSKLVNSLNEIGPCDLHTWNPRAPLFKNSVEPTIDVLSAYDFVMADHDPDYRPYKSAIYLDY